MSVFLQPLQTVTVGSGGAGSVTFSSIPQTYTDLVLKSSARSTQSATYTSVGLQFNGSATGYSQTWLLADGSTASSTRYSSTSITYPYWASGASATANTFNNGELYIPNYTGNNYKSLLSDSVSENNSSSAGAVQLILNSSLWSSTSAISSITIYCGSGNFVQYSEFSLYGVLRSGI